MQLRKENGGTYRVLAVRAETATVEPDGGGDAREVRTDDLLVVKRFGEPIYPALRSLGHIQRSDPSRPAHAVINGENYHALQLLSYFCEAQVDCIYIDPPYNSGARDWRYNNHYVDNNDRWKHSKWLSFMDKRLALAKNLLKPDGVLIVTVDENEVHHLALLIERLFPDPDYLRYTITIVYNPKGTGKANFGRVDEQALFIVPNVGHDLINPRPVKPEERNAGEPAAVAKLARELIEERLGEDAAREVFVDELASGAESTRQLEIETAAPAQANASDGDDDLSAVEDESQEGVVVGRRPDGYEDLFLRRRGQESSHRANRPNQFYALLVNEVSRSVVGIGTLLGRDDPYTVTKDGDVLTVYPINNDGEERVWRYNRETMQAYIDARSRSTVPGQCCRRRDAPKAAAKPFEWRERRVVHGSSSVVRSRHPLRGVRRVTDVAWTRAAHVCTYAARPRDVHRDADFVRGRAALVPLRPPDVHERGAAACQQRVHCLLDTWTFDRRAMDVAEVTEPCVVPVKGRHRSSGTSLTPCGAVPALS